MSGGKRYRPQPRELQGLLHAFGDDAPVVRQREPPACGARHGQSAVHRSAEVAVQCAVDLVDHHVRGSGHGVRGDRRAACHGLQHHQSERIGQRRKDDDVRVGIL